MGKDNNTFVMLGNIENPGDINRNVRNILKDAAGDNFIDFPKGTNTSNITSDPNEKDVKGELDKRLKNSDKAKPIKAVFEEHGGVIAKPLEERETKIDAPDDTTKLPIKDRRYSGQEKIDAMGKSIQKHNEENNITPPEPGSKDRSLICNISCFGGSGVEPGVAKSESKEYKELKQKSNFYDKAKESSKNEITIKDKNGEKTKIPRKDVIHKDSEYKKANTQFKEMEKTKYERTPIEGIDHIAFGNADREIEGKEGALAAETFAKNADRSNLEIASEIALVSAEDIKVNGKDVPGPQKGKDGKYPPMNEDNVKEHLNNRVDQIAEAFGVSNDDERLKGIRDKIKDPETQEQYRQSALNIAKKTNDSQLAISSIKGGVNTEHQQKYDRFVGGQKYQMTFKDPEVNNAIEESKGKESKGKDSKGKSSKEKESKGKESKGKSSKEKDSKGKESKEKESKGKESKGKDSKGREKLCSTVDKASKVKPEFSKDKDISKIKSSKDKSTSAPSMNKQQTSSKGMSL